MLGAQLWVSLRENRRCWVCALHAEAQPWLLERRRNLEKVLGLQWYAQDFRF